MNDNHENRKKLRKSVNNERMKELHKGTPRLEIAGLIPNQESIEVLIDSKSQDKNKSRHPPRRIDAVHLQEWMNENVEVTFIKIIFK
jgi:hypothetical protein